MLDSREMIAKVEVIIKGPQAVAFEPSEDLAASAFYKSNPLKPR